MELLSPVSSANTLKAAVQNGADAVYLGGIFSARRNAEPIGDLCGAAAYAHTYGVKIYYALNTLLYDRELDAFLLEANYAASAGADAFIVQDLGAFSVLKETFPDVPLHVSTQALVHNTDNALAFYNIDASRIVLARELSFDQVAKIATSVPVEIEVFAHGALCYSFSGACLMSSALGGRGANRGDCAQPCRLNYKCAGKSGHLLSPKDLCLLDNIPLLQKSGVHSIKIEGRMKNADYVAAVTRAYRKALDGFKITNKDKDALLLTYNRGGFTKGLFMGAENRIFTQKSGHCGLKVGRVVKVGDGYIDVLTDFDIQAKDEITSSSANMSFIVASQSRKHGVTNLRIKAPGVFKPGDDVFVTYSTALSRRLKETFDPGTRRIFIKGRAKITAGAPSELELDANGGLTVSVTGAVPEEAVSRPLSEDDIRESLIKLGTTPFEFERLEIVTDGLSSLPKSALNELRRLGTDALLKNLTPPACTNITKPLPRIESGICRIDRKITRIAAHVHTIAQATALKDITDVIYAPPDIAKTLKSFVLPELPLITPDDELEKYKEVCSSLPEAVIHTHIDIACPKTAGHGFNITNSRSLNALFESGFNKAVLSPELSAAQIRDLNVPVGMEIGVVAYGRVPLMTSVTCPINCNKRRCKIGEGMYIEDRKRMRMPLLKVGENCRVAIFNALPIFMADKLKDISADFCSLYFTVETSEECAEVVKAYRSGIDGCAVYPPPSNTFTRGWFYKKIKKV